MPTKTFLEVHDPRTLRDACEELGVPLPEAAAAADKALAKAQAALDKAANTPPPTDDVDALVEYQLTHDRRVQLYRDAVREAEYSVQVGYTKSCPELFEAFAKLYSADVAKFIELTDQLDPAHQPGGLRAEPDSADPFGDFVIQRILDAGKAQVFAEARTLALRIQKFITLRGVLAMGREPNSSGLLVWPTISRGGRFAVACRYSLGGGRGEDRDPVSFVHSLRLMPGIELRYQDPEAISREIEVAEREIRQRAAVAQQGQTVRVR